jgi:hypothetical protein
VFRGTSPRSIFRYSHSGIFVEVQTEFGGARRNAKGREIESPIDELILVYATQPKAGRLVEGPPLERCCSRRRLGPPPAGQVAGPARFETTANARSHLAPAPAAQLAFVSHCLDASTQPFTRAFARVVERFVAVHHAA